MVAEGRAMKKLQGFSLVELAIVLVILGLLVGGVLSGRSLIRASELRTITTQQQQYVTAAHSFKEKYFYLPGDMPNATQLWGPSSDCTMADSGTLTCNGNGDGFVRSLFSPNDTLGGMIPMILGNDERYRFWQHLANARLIEGQFDGVLQDPPMKMNPLLFWTATDLVAAVSGRSTIFDGEYRNILLANAQLLPAEVWGIDNKIDDGKPGSGKMVVYAPNFGSNLSVCTTVAAVPLGGNLTADYLLTGTSTSCGFIFKRAF
jgi:prepilin-type N-terminal cleavage/methylation domain-containing protein